MKGKISYNNLIDYCVAMDENSDLNESGSEMFLQLIKNYFFPETESEKGMLNFFNDFTVPDFIQELSSLINVDIDKLLEYIEGGSPAESLSGKVYTSKYYLKIFFSNHPPDFSKVPSDVKMEIIQKVKKKNEEITNAFKKMKLDREYDKKRTILRLTALVLKNIHLKTGLNFSKNKSSIIDSINKDFKDYNEVFTASQVQMANLNDDTFVKNLVKNFFQIKNFQDIADISELFKEEVDRYKKRALRP